MAKITSMEPAAGEGLFIGSIIFEIARENCRSTHANIAGFACGQGLVRGIQNRNLNPRARIAAGTDRHGRIIFQAMPGGRQHGDIAGHLAQAEILHQARAELAQRVFLILPIHWRAGIDHVAER